MTAYIAPTAVVNAIKTTNAFPELSCYASGYMSIVSALCSASNLACIAFNRWTSYTARNVYGIWVFIV